MVGFLLEGKRPNHQIFSRSWLAENYLQRNQPNLLQQWLWKLALKLASWHFLRVSLSYRMAKVIPDSLVNSIFQNMIKGTPQMVVLVLGSYRKTPWCELCEHCGDNFCIGCHMNNHNKVYTSEKFVQDVHKLFL